MKWLKHISHGAFFVPIPFLINSCLPNTDVPLEDRFQSVLDRGIEKSDERGVSAAVIFPGRSTWAGVSGISHEAVPMQSDMLFHVGSVTKTFVATIALQLVEEGKIALDAPISKWLPDYPHVDGNITIRQLLNHTSGLYMFWENEELWGALKKNRERVWTPEEVLAYIKEPDFRPGEGWRYSNTNYLLMAMIIENVTGTTLASQCRSRFWDPMELTNSCLAIQDEIPENLAHVFGDNFQFGAEEKDLTFTPRASHDSIGFGSSGVVTTAEDLTAWCHELFKGNTLSPESMDEMLEFVEFKPIANMRAYGLGVQEFERQFSSGEQAIGHGGGNIGSATYMAHLPDHGVTIVVMVNAFPTSGIDYITKKLIRVSLRELGAVGILPYVQPRRLSFFVACFITSLTVVLFVRTRNTR